MFKNVEGMTAQELADYHVQLIITIKLCPAESVDLMTALVSESDTVWDKIKVLRLSHWD